MAWLPDIDYGASTRRLFWLTAVIGAGASVWVWLTWGKPAGLGFGLGSAGSVVSLWMWDIVAASLGGRARQRSPLATTLFAIRFLALFAFGYAIVRALDVSPLAAVFGLLTSSAAVVAEILLELAFGRLSR